ncbi:MAG: hypothetical protein RLO12_05575 [Fulvivirga sp.]
MDNKCMVNFENIREHIIERPDATTCLGTSEDYDSLSIEHKDQIRFLDEEASKFLYKYFEVSRFHTGPLWNPFEKKNFKYTEKINVNVESQTLKKWLFDRSIAFSKWVYVLPNYTDYPITMTWKMVIKYFDTLFFGDDIIIFDESNQWCLTYWHEDELFFGRINTVDPEIGYKEVEEMNLLEKKYPGYKHPLK